MPSLLTFGVVVMFIQYLEKFFAPIRDLSTKRDAYLSTPVAAAPAAPATASAPTATAKPMSKAHHSAVELDDAFVGTVRRQATDSGYSF